MRKQYETADGKQLELRPYLLSAEEEIWDREKIRRYENFRTLVTNLQSDQIAYAPGKDQGILCSTKRGRADCLVLYEKQSDG